MAGLSQSDRNYGFYYDIELEEGGTGYSYIVSEGNGGSARHRLNWRYEQRSRQLIIDELVVVERTDEQWKWCIKSATLQLASEEDAYRLTGDWKGQLEGTTSSRGTCAPGQILLEKPVVSRQVVKWVTEKSNAYQLETQREIKIERIIQVKNPHLRIKVWDNGTVDGDVVTIFLNGDQLLNKQRVSKRKIAIPVSLEAEYNFLILHAEDLGEITPNTVAVSIDDGVDEQIIILSSNLRESGAVMVKQFKVE